jgi:hypothetical protein
MDLKSGIIVNIHTTMAAGAKASIRTKTGQVLTAGVHTATGCAVGQAAYPGLHNTTLYIFELLPAEFFAGQIVFCTHKYVQFLGTKSCQKLWCTIVPTLLWVFGFAL